MAVNIKAGPVMLAVKLGPKLLGLLTKALKSVKLGLGVASLASYGVLFTWEFAVVILITLVVHEYGHLRAMRAFGMKTKGIYLIPFVGGAAVAESGFPSRWAEAFVALAGPAVGLVQVAICAMLYAITGLPFWAAITSWCALLNLINLLPITPLDGGRVVKSMCFSVHRKLGLIVLVVGLFLAAILLAMTGAFLLGVIMIAGAIDAAAEWRRRNDGMRKMRPVEIGAMFAAFLMLALSLVAIAAAMDTPEARLAMEILQDRHTDSP